MTADVAADAADVDVDDPGHDDPGAGLGSDDPLYAELLAALRGGAGPPAAAAVVVVGRRPQGTCFTDPAAVASSTGNPARTLTLHWAGRRAN